MNALVKAKARLKGLLDQITALGEKDQLTADDLAALNKATADAEAVEAEIDALVKAEAARARAAAPAHAGAGEGGGTVIDRGHNNPPELLPADIKKDMTQAEKISVVASATLKAQLQKVSALKILSDEGYASFAKELGDAMRRKAIDTTTAQVLIPDPVSGDIIEYLRPKMTFLQGKPRKVQFTHGKFKQPRGASGASAAYVGEGQKKPVTDVSFDEIDMRARKVAGIVLITQEAKDWSLPNIDAYIREDLRGAVAQHMDLNAYFGTGAGDSPVGILNKTGVPHFNADDFPGVGNQTAPTIANIDAMATTAILSLTTYNLMQDSSWAWVMSYRTFMFLQNMRVGDTFTGMLAYPELQGPNPTFKGIRVLVTNQIPSNMGSSTDETLMALIDFNHVLYAEEGGILIKTSDQATVDVNGTLVHLWQQNMYGILAEHQHDFGLRYSKAIAVIDNIRWGAGAYNTAAGTPY